MEIKGDIKLLLFDKNIKVFTKNDDALKYIEHLKRKGVLQPYKYSIVAWDNVKV